MGLDLIYKELKCYSCVLDTVMRREEAQEAIVSDSMPDIGTILNASGTAMIQQCRCETGTVLCDLDTSVNVIYEAEGEERYCSIPMRIPIHCALDAPNVAEHCRNNASCDVRGVEVKMVNPRKILVKVEVAVHICAYEETKTPYATDVDSTSSALQTKVEHIPLHIISAVSEKTFPFEDRVSCGNSRREFSELLSCDLVPYCNEAKIVGSKVIFKGGIRIRMRLLCDDGSLNYEEQELPVSQILDAGNSDEGATVQVSLCVSSFQAMLTGENEIDFRSELYACCAVYDSKELAVLTDAYSTDAPCQTEFATNRGFRLRDQGILSVPFRQMIDLEATSADLLDQSILLSGVSIDTQQDKIKCCIKVHVVFKDVDGALLQSEKTCFVDLDLNGRQSGHTSTEVTLLEAACVSTVGGMEIRGVFLVQSTSTDEISFCSLSQITPLEQSSEAAGARPSAVLRMKREGESLWDLGKAYGATVDDIMAVNQISDENAACNKFLLIPRNR